MSFDEAPTAQLEALFRRIHATEMAGMPVLNPALAVEALGFRRCAYGWLGILITPWFMNLMLLPAAGLPWTSPPPGKPRSMAFPSGDYVFTADGDAALGEYLSCRLFSPMHPFSGQEAARTAARAALEAVWTAPPAADETVVPGKRRLLRGILRASREA